MKVKKTSRLIGAMLALVMVFALFPAAAMAEGTAEQILEEHVSLQEAAKTYTGEEQTFSVTVKIGDKELAEGTDYELSGNKATLPGIYTLKVTGKGAYTGEVSKEYVINKTDTEAKTEIKAVPGEKDELELSPYINEGGTLGNVSTKDEDKILKEVRVDEKNILHYSLAEDAAVGKTATVTILVTAAENSTYNNYSIEVKFTVGEGAVVSFDANGGSGSMESMSVPIGTEITIPECAFTAPEGMIFDSWDGGKPGETYTVKGDTVFVAQWREVKKTTVTVTYDFNDEGATDKFSETKTFLENEENIFTAISPNERQCYNFKGWAYDGQIIAAGADFTATADMTLTAQWEQKPLKTYTILFDANGGQGAPATQTGESRCGEVKITLSNDVPTNGDKKFAGWSLSKTEPKPILQPGEVAIVNDQFPTITLYAVWLDPNANPKTGDEANIGLWAALLSISAIGAGAALYFGRKKEN